jgi:hypothetical protein
MDGQEWTDAIRYRIASGQAAARAEAQRFDHGWGREFVLCRFRSESAQLFRPAGTTLPVSILVASNALHLCAEGV